MRARKWALIAVVVVVAVVAARGLGLWVGGFLSRTHGDDGSQQPLVYADEDLDFGLLPEGDKVTRPVRITNQTAETITLGRFEYSCSCLEIEPGRDVVFEPGQTRTFHMTVHTGIPDGAAPTGGVYERVVDIAAVRTSAGGHKPGRSLASLRYRLEATVIFDPDRVDVGTVSHLDPLSVQSKVTFGPRVADVRIIPHPEWDVRWLPASHGDHVFRATPTRRGEVRLLSSQIMFLPVAADGSELPPRSFTIKGEVRPDVGGWPASLPLGRMSMNQETEESVRFVSLTDRHFTVIEVEGDEGVTVEPNDPEKVSVRVRVRASGEGEQRRSVRARIRTDEGGEFKAVVPVTYFSDRGAK